MLAGGRNPSSRRVRRVSAPIGSRRTSRSRNAWLVALAAVCSLFWGPAVSVRASTFVIPCGETAGLIAAIVQANNETTNPGRDTVQLTAGCVYTLTASNANVGHGPNGLPIVGRPSRSRGTEASIARDAAAPAFRLFEVSSAGNLIANDVVFEEASRRRRTEGCLQPRDHGRNGGTFEQNVAAHHGGISNHGTLFITGTTFSGNQSNGGSAQGGAIGSDGNVVITGAHFISNSAPGGDGTGAGIWTSGQLTVAGSDFSGNVAGYSGGGIDVASGSATVTDSSFTNNRGTAGHGGGVGNLRGNLTVVRSSFSSNYAYRGGGIGAQGESTTDVRDSTFTGNSADRGGGLTTNSTMTVSGSTFTGNSAGKGGAFRNFGTATMTNSTFTSNVANDSGGGIANSAGLTVTNSTLFANTSGTKAAGVSRTSRSRRCSCL